MKSNVPVLLIAIFLVGVCSPNLYAQDDTNDQTVVIGIGFGIHTFSETDDVRQNVFLIADDVAGMGQLYVEWYVFETIGFGIRSINLGVTETISFGTTIETELSVDNNFFTVNWVPLGADSYARMGLLAGVGNSNYEVTQTVTPGGTSSISSSGSATLLGIYVDWGGEDFGARFGANFLETDLDDINGLTVDASGRSIYFDLRWAFN
ncbi:MAG: hypothetical protein O7B79_02675 [SAR324 cluster bacterium]|nr:hypothetical protein [SAR324 cluster bacterium]